MIIGQGVSCGIEYGKAVIFKKNYKKETNKRFNFRNRKIA